MTAMSRTIAILGASGHGKVAADIATQCGWQRIIFYDDAWPDKTSLEHWPIIGTAERLQRDAADLDGVFVAIGDNAARYRQLNRLRGHARLATLLHPAAIVSPYATLGEASLLVAGAIVNAFATLGPGSIVNTGATVGHDCWLGECVHVAPGANLGGDTRVGDLAWIGIGASVRQGMHIGRGAMIGAGAAVVAPVDDHQVVAGVPARPLHKP